MSFTPVHDLMGTIFKDKKYLTDPQWIAFMLTLLTLSIRLAIYYTTTLFSFSDYGSYLSVIENINSGDKVFLQNGNCFFAISFIGYFAKYVLGSIDYFFIFICVAGTLTSLVLFNILKNTFHSALAGLFAVTIYINYTEFIVFSSVFYTPVIMILLLSVFVLLLSYYYRVIKILPVIISTAGLVIIFLLTFLFKPELMFFPIFLVGFPLFFIRNDKIFLSRSLALALILLTSYFFFNSLQVVNRPDRNIIFNSFFFYGHTNYGGDGGEGDFVYPENEARYNHALADWCKENYISQPDIKDITRFQHEEIFKFVTRSPFAWIKLQGTKFFRTFGVVPESTSFMVLYTGLLKGNLWLTSIVVVAPVALIILLFIIFFNFSALVHLTQGITAQPTFAKASAVKGHNGSEAEMLSYKTVQKDKSTKEPEPSTRYQLMGTADRGPQTNREKHFLYVYFLLFFYYLIATVFFGQYQERYRMPLMVVFIIPLLGYFIAKFDRKQFLNRISLSIKCAFILLFMTIWVFQAKKALSNKARFDNAIESVQEKIKDKR